MDRKVSTANSRSGLRFSVGKQLIALEVLRKPRVALYGCYTRINYVDHAMNTVVSSPHIMRALPLSKREQWSSYCRNQPASLKNKGIDIYKITQQGEVFWQPYQGQHSCQCAEVLDSMAQYSSSDLRRGGQLHTSSQDQLSIYCEKKKIPVSPRDLLNSRPSPCEFVENVPPRISFKADLCMFLTSRRGQDETQGTRWFRSDGQRW